MALNIIVEDSKHCTPCKTKDKKIESQYYCTDCEAYYCEDCFELHPRVPYLAKHIVLKHDDIAVWSKLQYKCTTHDKNLEFFCGEHKLLCCHVCVSLKHRACANMEYVLESAKNICLNDEIKTMIQHTQEKLDKIESYAEKIRYKTEVNEKSKEEYIKELEEYRSKLNKMFDVLMKNAIKEMNERVDKNTKYSEEMTQDLKNFKQELQDLKHQLTTSTAGKEVLIYISLKRGENLIEEITRKLSEIDITTDKDNFKPVLDNTVQEYVGNIKQIVYLEDERMRKDVASRKECLMQSAVSSEEYQAQTFVSIEECKMPKTVQCEEYDLVQNLYEEIHDIPKVQENVPNKDNEDLVQENVIHMKEIELPNQLEPDPESMPFGINNAKKFVTCENYPVERIESIADWSHNREREISEPQPKMTPFEKRVAEKSVPCENYPVERVGPVANWNSNIEMEISEPEPKTISSEKNVPEKSVPYENNPIKMIEPIANWSHNRVREIPVPQPKMAPFEKNVPKKYVPRERYPAVRCESIANWGQYENRECCSNCGERFKSKRCQSCQWCGQRRK